MSAFSSDAAAYVVGVVVGVVTAVAILAGVGVFMYKKLGIANIGDSDEELETLRRQASSYEIPHQADRSEPAERPQTQGGMAVDAVPVSGNESSGQKSSLAAAAITASIAKKATADSRKQAWRF